jgi:hypothetical protein
MDFFAFGVWDLYTMKTFNKSVHIQHEPDMAKWSHTRRSFQRDDLHEWHECICKQGGELFKKYIYPNEAPSTVLRA